MPQEKSAGAIIFKMTNGIPYYLLLHYLSGHWEFAKGHVEPGETEEQTVHREIKEETGIDDIIIISGFKEYIKYFFRNNYGLKKEEKAKAPWIFKLVVFYLAQTTKEQVILSDEHTGFIWLSHQEALKKLTFKNAKNILTKAHNYLNDHLISTKSV